MAAAVDRAVAYVFRHGRPVDAAELAFHLGQGTADVVMHLLGAYRNLDGGFGHGLEPDVRSPASSVLATTVALQRMVRVRVDPKHPMVRTAMGFLAGQMDPETTNWPLVTAEVRESACAPWWRGYNASEWGELNPRAEVLSYFVRFGGSGGGGGVFDEARRLVLSRLAKETALDMHELQCVARLLRTPGIDGTVERTCREALERDLPKVLPRSAEQCAGYVLKPLTVARRPNSVLAGLVESSVEVQHGYEVATQRRDGAWDVPWNWNEPDSQDWRAAEREWRSHLTMLTASSLHAYGR